MTTMRLTLQDGNKIDVNPTQVALLKENLVVLSTGLEMVVQESLRSLRHQHRKALTAQKAVGQAEATGE